MTTFEVTGASKEQRQFFRDKGYQVENLGDGFCNVTCENDDDADRLTELIESLNLEYRFV